MKKVVSIIVSMILCLICINIMLIFPNKCFECLHLFIKDSSVCYNVAGMICIILLIFLSSNRVYHNIHRSLDNKVVSKNTMVKCLSISVLAFWDILASLPKRTIIFAFYLVILVLKQLQIDVFSEELDLYFLGAFLISVDRLTQAFGKEKQVMFKYGEKAYGDNRDITDKVV